MRRSLVAFFAIVLTMLVGLSSSAHAAEPLKIAYSDWPGWVAWDVAIQKGWFKEAGVDVEFIWFEYGPSMEAFSAGKVDGLCVTNGDQLVTGASGKKSICILANDFSNGNDMIIGQPGINSIKELKGKKIGVEVNYVDHLMILKALEANGMKEADVQLVNIPTNDTPQALASGGVDAIAAWQPSSGIALKQVPGSKPIFTSKDVPGLIYDTLVVAPESLSSRREDWKKVLKVWDRVVSYVNDPKTQEDAVKIMAARVQVEPAVYAKLLDGTHLLTLEDNVKRLTDSQSLDTVYGSSRTADKFNTANGVYADSQDVPSYFDPTLVEEVLGK